MRRGQIQTNSWIHDFFVPLFVEIPQESYNLKYCGMGCKEADQLCVDPET